MKLWVLAENTRSAEDFRCEHGLSLYMEVNGHRILFDAGQSDAFLYNAEALGIDLSAVDMAILSHGHYDHGGGLKQFLQANQKAPVYLSQHAFGQHCSKTGAYIGLDPALTQNERLIFTEDRYVIDDTLTLLSCNEQPREASFNACGLSRRTEKGLIPDDFRHEQYLLIEEEGRRILISGCSHKGILNIMQWLKPDVLIGGFHFMRLDPDTAKADLLSAAEELAAYPTTYYTGHCTGLPQYALLKSVLGDRLSYMSTGEMLCP